MEICVRAYFRLCVWAYVWACVQVFGLYTALTIIKRTLLTTYACTSYSYDFGDNTLFFFSSHPSLNSAVQNVLGKKYTDVGVGAGAGVLGGGGGGTTGAGSNTAATAGRHIKNPLFLSSSHTLSPSLFSFLFPFPTLQLTSKRRVPSKIRLV